MKPILSEKFLKAKEKCKALSVGLTDWLLIVSIMNQELEVFYLGDSIEKLPVSTSKNPPSCIENSFGTPWGLHRIMDKIGGGAPLGMVFKGKKAIGHCYQNLSAIENEKNLITSRIFRLEGLEEGVNKGGVVDTYDRYVYFHGTNHEDKIGCPASAGCIQLTNAEIIRLFDLLPTDTLVFIDKD